ncbi:amidohydrolase [Microbacterium sp. SORGH_AS_0888]|uniref:amidohydrolase family protein n=1 Tax=Microbacterium sp. SORGH_AS_0888 TaxID=3041791 RepID=UPI00358E8DAB
MRIAIDHLGKPPIGGTPRERDAWRALARAAAEHPGTVAKLSGLYPPTGDARAWTLEDVRPFVEDAREIFGADRLMYGSDWPIAELAGGHRRVHDALTELTSSWTDGERDAVFSGTATTFYRIPDPTERTSA